jgi:hypothetical protein
MTGIKPSVDDADYIPAPLSLSLSLSLCVCVCVCVSLVSSNCTMFFILFHIDYVLLLLIC